MHLEYYITPSAKYRLILAVLGATGVATILLATRHYGAGLSPDSVGYIATARHIASGSGFVTFDGTPLVYWPPLYPALLAVASYIFRVDPISLAHVFNAILFGFIVYLSGLLFLKHLKSSAVVALFGAGAVLVAIPLIQVSLMAWSEPLFICFVLLYLVLFESYLKRRDMFSLVILSLSVALACLTRYIGIVLILTGVVGILLFRQGSLRVKFIHLLIFVSISVSPIGMWIARNYFLSGTLFGSRQSSIFTFPQNLAFTLGTLIKWYTPRIIYKQVHLLLMIAIVVSFVAILGAKIFWSKILSEMGTILLYIVTYVGFLVISSTTTAYDRINDRLLSPIYVPMTLLILWFVSQLLVSLTGRHVSRRVVNFFLASIVILWLGHPVIVSTSLIAHAMNYGNGYSSESWRNSETIGYLLQNKDLELRCTIYTNNPPALYILANLKAQLTPKRTHYNSTEIANNISSLKGFWPEEDRACLVWFNRDLAEYLFTIDELGTIADIQLGIEFEDGAIYYVARK